MIDDIIAELESVGWVMDPYSGLTNCTNGFGYTRPQDSVQNAMWRIIERRWREKAKSR